MLENTGSAILIIGAIWLHLVYGLHIVWTVFFCVWGLGFWLTIDAEWRNKLRQLETEKKQLEIDLLRAKIEYYKEKVGARKNNEKS